MQMSEYRLIEPLPILATPREIRPAKCAVNSDNKQGESNLETRTLSRILPGSSIFPVTKVS